jgi:hypothetical protein
MTAKKSPGAWSMEHGANGQPHAPGATTAVTSQYSRKSVFCVPWCLCAFVLIHISYFLTFKPILSWQK